jgi:hypothetical protein
MRRLLLLLFLVWGCTLPAAADPIAATRYPFTAITTAVPNNICTQACLAYGLSAINLTGATCYVQEFNALAANVTVGTTAPQRVLLVPAGAEAADNLPPSATESYNTAWSYVATTSPTNVTACGSTIYVQADYH